MIQIKISSPDNTVALTTILSPSYSSLMVNNVLQAVGTASFDIGIYDPKSTPAILNKYNRVKIYDGTVLLFNGYISAWRVSGESSDVISVTCKHIFGLFDKRITGNNENWSMNAGAAILGLLSSTNAAKDTKITAGINLISSTINQTFKRQTILKAWQQIANAGALEFEIDDNDHLNIRPKIGEDKTASVSLRYTEDQNNTSTIAGLDLISQGDDMANDVIGTAGNLVSQQTDSVSQGIYGLLQKVTSFSDNPAQASLDQLTIDYLNQNKYSKDIPTIVTLNDKIAPYSLKLGDTVRVILKKGIAINVDSNYRITGLNFTYQDTGQPEVKVVLSDTFTRNIIPDAVQDIKSMQDRISSLERN